MRLIDSFIDRVGCVSGEVILPALSLSLSPSCLPVKRLFRQWTSTIDRCCVTLVRLWSLFVNGDVDLQGKVGIDLRIDEG